MAAYYYYINTNTNALLGPPTVLGRFLSKKKKKKLSTAPHKYVALIYGITRSGNDYRIQFSTYVQA